MAKSNVLKMMVTLFCFGGSIACLYNVYSDNRALQAEASALACDGSECYKLLGQQRSPLSQTFTFQVKENSAATRLVSCARAAFLVGPYSCETQQ